MVVTLVAGRHPLKQGLKHHRLQRRHDVVEGRRAASTKTRIETFLVWDGYTLTPHGRRAASTKTRIETPEAAI